MTEECITPLRRRMIENVSIRRFASKTQQDYIRTVMKLTRFLGRSPDTATNEDLRRFQLHLTENRAFAPSGGQQWSMKGRHPKSSTGPDIVLAPDKPVRTLLRAP